MTPFPRWLARQVVARAVNSAKRGARRVARRRVPEPVRAVLETVLLPNGQFLLLLSNLGDGVTTEELIAMNEALETLGDRVGAGAVLLMSDRKSVV